MRGSSESGLEWVEDTDFEGGRLVKDCVRSGGIFWMGKGGSGMASEGVCFLYLRPKSEFKDLDLSFGFSETYSGAGVLLAFIDHHGLEGWSRVADMVDGPVQRVGGREGIECARSRRAHVWISWREKW